MREASPARAPLELGRLLAAEETNLMGCVHCGFCLPACPTYVRLGDENDSPRGRLYLMKAVIEGRLDAGSDAFQTHIDRCLGCRACEPVCPSGVEYGKLLEAARATAIQARPLGSLTRLLLGTFQGSVRTRLAMAAAALFRASGLPLFLVRVLPRGSSARFGLAMLAASGSNTTTEAAGLPAKGAADASAAPVGSNDMVPVPAEGLAVPVAMLEGCVQKGLFARVNQATRRTLGENGYAVVAAPGQACCGALHAHAGDLGRARVLARANIDAFESTGAQFIAVNAAGCGAAMREYGHLLEGDVEYGARAAALAASVRDVTELLAQAGPVNGASLHLSVTYDAPCHLHHAQRVTEAPLQVLRSIPGLELRPLARADECCGGAGIYGITHPELASRIGGDKVRAVLDSGADGVVTGNPGCMMQIGAGLLLEGSDVSVWHPVELLDESYRKGGRYT